MIIHVFRRAIRQNFRNCLPQGAKAGYRLVRARCRGGTHAPALALVPVEGLGRRRGTSRENILRYFTASRYRGIESKRQPNEMIGLVMGFDAG